MTWDLYEKAFLEERIHNRQKGLSYIVSGSIVTGLSLVAFSATHDPMTRMFSALSQSIGIIAIGEGAHLYYSGTAEESFYETLARARSLTPAQRDELTRIYLSEERHRKETDDRIRGWTYATIAVLTFYNASREPDPTVRTALGVLGAANLAYCLSFVF